MWITSAHVPGVLNVEADEASRVFDDNTEWSMSETTYESLCNKLEVQPKTDWFASRLNHKCETYCAWQPDPGASVIDAFMADWHGSLGYFFPPFGLMGKVLEKFIQDKATGLIVAPFWPSQPWFPVLADLMCTPPVTIDLSPDHVSLPFRTKVRGHPLQGRTTLLAATCHAGASSYRGTARAWSTSCPLVDGRRPRPATPPTPLGGKGFVSRGRWTRAAPL